MTPGERWVQRVMGGLGVRPVGHPDPRSDEDDTTAPAAPVIPVQPSAPAPGWPPAEARRISTTAAPGSLPAPGRTVAPDWALAALAEGERKTAEGRQAATAAEVEDQDDDGRAEYEEAPAAPPTPTGPVAKIPPRARPLLEKIPHSGGGKSLKGDPEGLLNDPNFRTTVFNLSAAAVGYATPLAGIVDVYLVAAERAAVGIFAFILALAGFGATWWVTSRPAVREILSCLPYWPLVRIGLCAGLAELARRMAPLPVAWLNHHGKEWGLGPNAVSLLITSGGICFLLWWFIDRKLRRFHWSVRWLFRVPLATAVVATLLFGKPVH